tara:strand:- start:2110 stop:2790 length:681 start_codon:yes stop_codon:yes gene_type:complete
LAKRLSDQQKEEIIRLFTLGKTIDELSKQFNCTKSTISRNLNKHLGGEKYKELALKGQEAKKLSDYKKANISVKNINSLNKKNDNEKYDYENKSDQSSQSETLPISPFLEIIPLEYEIENKPQKDLSSIPIAEISFPKIVYMIVDKKVELEIKFLKDYPEWQFLSQDELNRKTIAIYFNIKIAKRFCTKEQKVIKVPNTDVFRITAPVLVSRGISRIVSEDKLIAL